MSAGPTAATYARSLFDLAALTDAVTDADEQLGEVVKTVRAHVDLRDALANPTVGAEQKREIVRGVFGEHVVPAVLAIVTLAAENGHVDMLGDVSAALSALVERELGVVPAQVVTAVPLSAALRASLTEKLSASLGKRVELREKVDPAIIGGIVINVAGRVLDGSLTNQLQSMRSALSTVPAGGEA